MPWVERSASGDVITYGSSVFETTPVVPAVPAINEGAVHHHEGPHFNQVSTPTHSEDFYTSTGTINSGSSKVMSRNISRPLVFAISTTISSKREQAERALQEVKIKTLERVEKHRSVLREERPEVAMLVSAADDNNDEENAETGASDIVLPAGLKLYASASLRFYGKPGKLLVLQLEDRFIYDDEEAQSPSEQLTVMLQKLKGWKGKCLDDTKPWPLHNRLVSEAIFTREMEVLTLEASSWIFGKVNRILHALRIFSPDEDGPLMTEIRRQYGEGVALVNVWSFFYVQALWLLVPFAVLMLVLGLRPPANTHDDHVSFEIGKGLLFIWGAAISVLCSTRFMGDQAIKEKQGQALRRQRSSAINRDLLDMSKRSRWLLLIFVAIPSVLLLMVVCCSTTVWVTNLVLHIIYVWGDCYNLHTPENVCRDATRKHGFLGWAAEVGCDIVLALLFEVFFAISASLSEWVSLLCNFEYENDRRYFRSMMEVFLSALERIGFVSSLAFGFVPAWYELDSRDTIDLSIDCSDLVFGESDYGCYQRRLPLSLRRWLLVKLMKGPFVVAPFISILVKTIVPYLVFKISQVCDYLLRQTGNNVGARFGSLPLRLIVRFFTLIFTLEGDNVGCFKFVCQGWPFSEVSMDPTPDGSDHKIMKEYKYGILSVLAQGVLKPFQPDDELMELEMSFLWVLFFTPLMPIGVITTLAARVLEIQFDMLKMLHVRQRSFPACDIVMRREQSSFVNTVLLASIAWTIALSLITYNDDLYKWGHAGSYILMATFTWWVLCAVLGFSRRMSLGWALVYARLPTSLRRSQSSHQDRPSRFLAEPDLLIHGSLQQACDEPGKGHLEEAMTDSNQKQDSLTVTKLS